MTTVIYLVENQQNSPGKILGAFMTKQEADTFMATRNDCGVFPTTLHGFQDWKDELEDRLEVIQTQGAMLEGLRKQLDLTDAELAAANNKIQEAFEHANRHLREKWELSRELERVRSRIAAMRSREERIGGQRQRYLNRDEVLAEMDAFASPAAEPFPSIVPEAIMRAAKKWFYEEFEDDMLEQMERHGIIAQAEGYSMSILASLEVALNEAMQAYPAPVAQSEPVLTHCGQPLSVAGNMELGYRVSCHVCRDAATGNTLAEAKENFQRTLEQSQEGEQV